MATPMIILLFFCLCPTLSITLQPLETHVVLHSQTARLKRYVEGIELVKLPFGRMNTVTSGWENLLSISSKCILLRSSALSQGVAL